MKKAKTKTMFCTLALAGAMTLSAFAVDAQPAPQLPKADDTPASAYIPGADGESPLTRAELIAVLYENEGAPQVSADVDYPDVDENAAYAGAVRWAAGEGIVNGYDNGLFAPEDPATREQTAAVLYRYARNQDQGFTGTWAFPLQYADAEEIADFAYEAVCWMTMHDVMDAGEDNAFAPKAQVSHHEAEGIFGRFFQTLRQTEIVNPFVECETMEEAAALAGFSMGLPQQSAHGAYTFRAMETGMIEAVCQGDADTLTIRKGVGSGDISGDYTAYSQTNTAELHGHTVTTKGENGKIMVASWSDGTYTYAVRSTAGLDLETLSSIVSEVE